VWTLFPHRRPSIPHRPVRCWRLVRRRPHVVRRSQHEICINPTMGSPRRTISGPVLRFFASVASIESIGRRCAILMHVPQLQTPETQQPARVESSLPTIPLVVFLAPVNGQRNHIESKLCGAVRDTPMLTSSLQQSPVSATATTISSSFVWSMFNRYPLHLSIVSWATQCLNACSDWSRMPGRRIVLAHGGNFTNLRDNN
jgi:hypothetical protein